MTTSSFLPPIPKGRWVMSGAVEAPTNPGGFYTTALVVDENDMAAPASVALDTSTTHEHPADAEQAANSLLRRTALVLEALATHPGPCAR